MSQHLKENDFASVEVPKDFRWNSFYVLLVWLGFVLVVGIMAIGGGLAGQMDRFSLVTAILVGNLILGLIAAFTGYVGARSGLTFNILMSRAFPGFSWKIVSLYVPIVLVGWYAIESALFANYVSQVLGWGVVGQHILMIVAAIGFSISAYLGFRTIGFVSMVLVPIIVILGIFSVIHVYTGANLVFNFGDTHIGTAMGISIVVSSWILAVLLCLPDLTRFCKKAWMGALVGFLGIFIGNTFNFFIGAAGAAMTRQFDPALILASVGFVALGLILSFANIWTTNDNNLYSAALNVSRMANISRKKAIIGCMIIGAIIAAFNPANLSFLFDVLIFMGNTAPALGGIVLGRYILADLLNRKVVDNSVAAWIGWIGGSALAFWTGGMWSIPVGLIAGFVVWWAISYFLQRRATANDISTENKVHDVFYENIKKQWREQWISLVIAVATLALTLMITLLFRIEDEYRYESPLFSYSFTEERGQSLTIDSGENFLPIYTVWIVPTYATSSHGYPKNSLSISDITESIISDRIRQNEGMYPFDANSKNYIRCAILGSLGVAEGELIGFPVITNVKYLIKGETDRKEVFNLIFLRDFSLATVHLINYGNISEEIGKLYLRRGAELLDKKIKGRPYDPKIKYNIGEDGSCDEKGWSTIIYDTSAKTI